MARDSTLGHQKRVVVMPGGGAGGAGVEVGGGLNVDPVPLPAVSTAESQEILEVRTYLSATTSVIVGSFVVK